MGFVVVVGFVSVGGDTSEVDRLGGVVVGRNSETLRGRKINLTGRGDKNSQKRTFAR